MVDRVERGIIILDFVSQGDEANPPVITVVVRKEADFGLRFRDEEGRGPAPEHCFKSPNYNDHEVFNETLFRYINFLNAARTSHYSSEPGGRSRRRVQVRGSVTENVIGETTCRSFGLKEFDDYIAYF